MYDLVWSIIPFAIILLIFAKFVLPKYSQMLQERRRTTDFQFHGLRHTGLCHMCLSLVISHGEQYCTL